ncbi:hypothetical protein [Methylobacterium gnaphalii]|uniref:Uncharacterized protein n=1 Tax=Methylobacterium gnaphalii TaxID=1010610 RepID=A0A512JF95_9HYPH|nr:hypothetical protein [Methylobacterium gnaphalii]GEP08614.1 hypothetical protein MGN01_04590 [Methylobacterium gnaphalii]GJD71233.1 hypothetical protein MMMDOFMJ_4187 [Methylobacterium gnaphalii]GLS50831.1 hypothetical protein GCM10007885_36850 [Methylobacterium gnaphalii]
MSARTASKVIRKGRLLWVAPRRALPASPPLPTGHTDALPVKPLTAADLIAMARAARIPRPVSGEPAARDLGGRRIVSEP